MATTITGLFISLFLAALSFAAGEGACDGACAKTYDKCIGRDIFSLKYCCNPGDHCVKFSKWYGQCRPKSIERFDADWLGIAEECRECGPESRVPETEFNFDENIYCELNFLGDFDLQGCAEVCASGPYVACDRPLEDPTVVTSCYGYSELFEGGCFMRVGNTFFESWLNCKASGAKVMPLGVDDNGPAVLSVSSLEADIAADAASTATEKAMARRKRDMLGK